MRIATAVLCLVGLCGLMSGQSTWSTSSGTIASSGTITSSGGSFLVSDGSGHLVSWAGVNDGTAETRSAKTPGITLHEVKSKAHKIPVSEIPTAAYMRSAKSIGLDSPAIAEAKLAEIIVNHGFAIYDYANVDNYLYHEALKQGTQMRWVWKPLRDADMKPAAQEAWSTWDGMGRISANSIYARAIPERVLGKVECLLTEMPDAIFMVSDYEVQRPDPFLAVTTPKMLSAHRIFIVDQWDEPGFTDKPIVKPYDEGGTLNREIVRAAPKGSKQSLDGN